MQEWQCAVCCQCLGLRCRPACRSTNIPSLEKNNKAPGGFDTTVFAQAPASVMVWTLQHVRTQYGGVCSYMERVCGFSHAEQVLLAQRLRPS